MNNKKGDSVFSRQKDQGFTLIELMITVVILGILSAITVPSYMAYVQKSKRTDAKVELLKVAQLQESYYVQNLSYAKQLNGASASGGLSMSAATLTTENGYYSVTMSATDSGGGTCAGNNTDPCVSYAIKAVPKSTGGQASDSSCQEFLITNTGARFAKSGTDSAYTNDSRDSCWK